MKSERKGRIAVRRRWRLRSICTVLTGTTDITIEQVSDALDRYSNCSGGGGSSFSTSAWQSSRAVPTKLTCLQCQRGRYLSAKKGKKETHYISKIGVKKSLLICPHRVLSPTQAATSKTMPLTMIRRAVHLVKDFATVHTPFPSQLKKKKFTTAW
jgi:hypothetical protein